MQKNRAHREIEYGIVQPESAACKGYPCGHLVRCVRTTAYDQLAPKSTPSVSVIVEM